MQPSGLVLLSGQMALTQAMDVIANNVANASTTGFKREGIAFDSLLQRTAPGKPALNFVVDRATYRDTSNGAITPTGNQLDLAIAGTGYFEVKQPDGTLAYTRGGSFQLDTDGNIVTQSGQQVVGEGGQAITLPDTTSEVNVSEDGFVTARIDNGVDLAQIGKMTVVKFDNEQQLQSIGGGLYTTTQDAKPLDEDDESAIQQGSLEESNVKPISEITSMIKIMRAYEQVTNMISMENNRHQTAIDKLSSTTGT